MKKYKCPKKVSYNQAPRSKAPRKKWVPGKSLICPGCEKEFVLRSPNQIFCGSKCRISYYHKIGAARNSLPAPFLAPSTIHTDEELEAIRGKIFENW
jgi:hypothetical protein